MSVIVVPQHSYSHDMSSPCALQNAHFKEEYEVGLLMVRKGMTYKQVSQNSREPGMQEVPELH